MRADYFILLIALVYLWSCQLSDDEMSNHNCMGYIASTNSDFVLPYPVGSSYEVIQGNCSHVSDLWNSHQEGTPWQYAYDFLMPIGTIITAPAAGVVRYVEERNSDDDKGLESGNAIVIEHDNGLFSGYGHLTQNGALVVVDQMIRQGDTIALSGNSGASQIPHLHFQIGPCLQLESCGSLPTTFRNTTYHDTALEKMEYLAMPY